MHSFFSEEKNFNWNLLSYRNFFNYTVFSIPAMAPNASLLIFSFDSWNHCSRSNAFSDSFTVNFSYSYWSCSLSISPSDISALMLETISSSIIVRHILSSLSKFKNSSNEILVWHAFCINSHCSGFSSLSSTACLMESTSSV